MDNVSQEVMDILIDGQKMLQLFNLIQKGRIVRLYIPWM